MADGMSNLQEFLTGTNPTDPDSVFRITSVSILGADARSRATEPSKTNQLEKATPRPAPTPPGSSVGSFTVGTGSPPFKPIREAPPPGRILSGKIGTLITRAFGSYSAACPA